MAKRKAMASSKTCLCSPTTHPGSFRCSLHRGPRKLAARPRPRPKTRKTGLKVGSKDILLKAFLMQIINPSRQDLQRRRCFQPRPTRSLVSSSGLPKQGKARIRKQRMEIGTTHLVIFTKLGGSGRI